MLFRRIVLLASRLRSIKGGLVAAIEDELENNDGEGDEDFGIFFAAFTFPDIFLSMIINKVKETIDTVERSTVGIKSDIVDE